MTKRPSDPGSSAAEEAVRRIPFRRKLAYVLLVWVIVFVVAEMGSRLGGYLIYGRSPFFLFYGIKSFMADSDPEGHSAAFDGYFKFPPNRTLHQYGLFTDPTPIRINVHGFRGPDFSVERPDSVVRIICLGESSTFGFFNSDEGTYPALLSSLLSDSLKPAPGKRYEVINAGIPHANSDNIRAMVEQEILRYRPDVITLYAGFNDAAALLSPSWVHRTMTWLHGHLASYVALKRLVALVGGPELPSRWSTQAAGSNGEDVQKQIALHSQRFRTNLARIVESASANGVTLILIKQALRPGWGDATGLAYQAKVDSARRVLANGGRIASGEATLVVHAALMRIVDSTAVEHGLELIDYIAIVDDHPEYFASYVHLTETGNLHLAREIADILVPGRSPRSAEAERRTAEGCGNRQSVPGDGGECHAGEVR